MDKLRITRRNRKGNLTRALKELACLVDGKAKREVIQEAISKARSRFQSVEETHEQLVELVTDEAEFEKEQQWIVECQDQFMTEIVKTEKLIDANEAGVENIDLSNENQKENEVDKVETDESQFDENDESPNLDLDVESDEANVKTKPRLDEALVENNVVGLFKTLSLPKPQIRQYEGDPLHYHAFISTFNNLIADIPDDNVKLNTLMSLCNGKALESIQFCVLKPPSDGLKAAISTLKDRFGNTAVIVQAWIDKILTRPKVDSGRLREFADDLNNCLESLSALGYLHELNNQGSLRQIVDKLPKFLQNRWQRENFKLKQKGIIPGLTDIVKFVKASSVEINDPVFGSNDHYPASTTQGHAKSKRVNQVSVSPNGTERKFPKCWSCKSDHHWPDQCPKILEMSVASRLDAAKDNHVCFSCLKVAGRNHRMSNCLRKKKCGVRDGQEECKKMHHRLLHSSSTTVGQVGLKGITEPLLSVLDVEALSKNGNMIASIMLDSGSQGTFIREDFARKLGISGRKVSACITKVGGTEELLESHLYEICLKGKEPERLHRVTALGMESINKVDSIDVKSLERKFNMANDTLQRRGGEIDILVGVDHAHLLTGDTVKSGSLIAQKSPLGWTVFGGQREDDSSKVMNVKVCRPVDMSDFWSTEAMGVDTKCDCKVCHSSTDYEAKLIEDSCQKVGDRWLVPYPWAKDPSYLTDNRDQAFKMLKGLEARLRKTPEHSKLYTEQVREMIELGFARKLSKEEMDTYQGPVHYIPHHPVIRPEKKSTPVRIVFNSSNKCNGEALNDYWFKGPDLLNNLNGVILRFREYPVGICGDISKMYHQVRIPKLDQHVHRFLWRDVDNMREPETYVKTVLTFGDKPAPAMALTALRMTAKENADKYPKASEILCRDTYMDDVCTSVKTVAEGAELTKVIDKILSHGGFKIKDWLSNQTLTDVKSTEKESQQLGGKQNQEKVLGVSWNHIEDNFVLNVKLDDRIFQDKITKRKALGVIAQVFDPIGIATPFVIKLKIKMQELWEMGVDWDDELSGKMKQEWHQLFEELRKINDVKIPRCLTPLVASNEVSLIVFCDASEKAFGSCAYARWKLDNGKFETRFITGKSRVAPLKRLTIPRLELQAAVMATRMGHSILEESTLTFKNKVYMTDSMIVLSWIRKHPGCFKQFVSARVTEVQEKSDAKDWRHVPGVHNPADDVSRGTTSETLQARYLHGPAFLLLPETEWPCENVQEVKDEKEERTVKACGNVDVNLTPASININDCQTWKDVIEIYRKKIYGEKSEDIDADKEKDIEFLLLRRIQKESFSEDYKLMKNNKPVPTSSRLANLSPEFDKESELIRVGGRLRRANDLDIDIHPVVLDPKHHLTKLLIRRIDDEIFHHSAGYEQVFSHLRRRFWILNGRSMVKSELFKCHECQRWRKQPEVPVMADLPEARLRVGKQAFYSTGMDCFGPYMIKIGRRQEKRWGIIFKCMTSKAIHLELLANMDTDAFLLAFRRFVNRKGTPEELYCDCGSNFIGADRELKECFSAMSKDMQDKLAERQVKFYFNPPNAPHFGGTWEREIRSVKNALKCCLKDRVVPEPVLQTVMTEVEGLINSKPLGYASSDVSDIDPITPNILLIGRADPASPPVSLSPREELTSKKQWRHSQVIADIFWKKFTTEYLTNFQVRQKWLKDSENLSNGDIVLVIDNQVHRGEWLIGKICKVYVSHDSKVRVVDVKINNKVYKRPVAKLIKLPEWK